MRAYKILIVIILLTTVSSFFACEKEKTEYITVTNTVLERDTIVRVDTLNTLDTVITIVRDTIRETDTLNNFVRDTVTTFILVRHAETTGIGTNPNLSALGQTRANNLSNILANVNLDDIYSTNYFRTKQTAQPIATDQSLTVLNYNPSYISSFIDNLLVLNHNGVVLIVGHSNTTPDFLNLLLGSNVYSTIPESEYDNLYVVSVFEKGRAEVVHLKY